MEPILAHSKPLILVLKKANVPFKLYGTPVSIVILTFLAKDKKICSYYYVIVIQLYSFLRICLDGKQVFTFYTKISIGGRRMSYFLEEAVLSGLGGGGGPRNYILMQK